MQDRGDIPGRLGQRRSTVDDDEPIAPKNNRQPLYLLLASVVVSFLVVMVWANSSLVSRSAYETDITNIVEDINALQATVSTVPDMAGIANSLNAQVGNLSNQVNAVTTEVNALKGSAITQDTINQINTNVTNLQNSLNSLQGQVNNIRQVDTSGLSASIETLKGQITALDTRLQALEAGGSSDSGSASGKVSVSIKTLGNNALSPVDNRAYSSPDDVWYNGSDGEYDGLQASIRMTLTNNTLYDIDDAIVSVEFSIYPSLPTYSYTMTSLSGGGVPWQREYSDSQYMAFYNGAWGLSIPAGQSVNLNMVLTIQGSENDDDAWNRSGGYYYQLQATVN